jgi:hypothetical protein
MALMIVGAMVSSSARGVTLGEASVLSTLGQPLRVAIPVSAGPRETIASDCIALIRTAGDGLGDVVTAKVSLERAAASPRLLVTTAQALYQPALRVNIEAGCQSPVRRSYALLLDQAAGASSASAATAEAPAPGQERPAAFVPAAARRDPPASSGIGAATYAQRPVVGADRGGKLTPAVLQLSGPAADSSNYRQTASVTETVRVTPPPRSAPLASERRNDTWWTIAIAVSGFFAIVLGAILVRHGRIAPRASAWSNANARSRTRGGPRSISQSSAAIATLSQPSTASSGLLTRAAPTTRAWAPAAPAVTLPNLSTVSKDRTLTRSISRPSAAAQREEVLDSLLNEIEGDLNVETAVRQVHAAAANSFGRDIGSDAILKAIEAAERDLMLASPPPAEAAMGHALDDELLGKRRDKAA